MAWPIIRIFRSGVQISDQPEQVNGCVLNAPELYYDCLDAPQVVRLNARAWNIRDQQFVEALKNQIFVHYIFQ